MSTWIQDAEVVTKAERDAATIARLCMEVEVQRKMAEAEGVTINGARYSGSPSNRQALLEAVQFAEKTGLETHPSFKDSDGKFHADHPASDVEQALVAIATRRGQLIALEGQYQDAIKAGEITSTADLDWAV